MRVLLKKIVLSLLLTLFIFANILPVLSQGSVTADFRINSVECRSGENFTITLSVNQIDNLGGFSGRIVYDNSALSYVQNSLSDVNSFLEKDFQVNCREDKSTVYFAWDSTNGINISGNLFSLKLTSLSNSKPGTYSIKLYIDDCYSATNNLQTIPYSFDKATCKIIDRSTSLIACEEKISIAQEKSYNVKNLLSVFSNARISYNSDIQNIQKRINALNSRSELLIYTEEFGNLINDAEQSYIELKASEKLSIQSSYNVLINLKKLYTDCKRELEIFSSESEVNNFRTTYSTVLNKTQEDISVNDRDSVDAAIASYNNSSYAVKVLLNNEINLLNKLQSTIKTLESDDRPANIKRIKEEEIPKLEKKYEGILNFTNSDINEDNAFNEAIMKVVNEACEAVTGQMIIDEGYEYLYKPLDDKLTDIKLKLDTIAGRTSKFANVTRFNKDFRDLKKKSSDQISLSDRDNIMQAYYLLGMMSSEELKEVGTETVNKISEMVTMIGSLELLESENNQSDVQTVTETIEKIVPEEVITVISGGKEKVYTPGKNMYQLDKKASSHLWTMGLGNSLNTIKTAVIITFVTLIIFIISLVLSIILQKQIRRKEDEFLNGKSDLME